MEFKSCGCGTAEGEERAGQLPEYPFVQMLPQDIKFLTLTWHLLMWHPCQKDVASCLLQLLDRIDETLT